MPTRARRTALVTLALLVAAASASAEVPRHVLHTFLPDGPKTPRGMVAGSDGNFYVFDSWTVFRMSAEGEPLVLHTFPTTAEECCIDSLVEANGIVYGVRQISVGTTRSSVFSVHTDGSGYAVLHSFDETTDGIFPEPLVGAPDGMLFGVLERYGTGGRPAI